MKRPNYALDALNGRGETSMTAKQRRALLDPVRCPVAVCKVADYHYVDHEYEDCRAIAESLAYDGTDGPRGSR